MKSESNFVKAISSKITQKIYQLSLDVSRSAGTLIKVRVSGANIARKNTSSVTKGVRRGQE